MFKLVPFQDRWVFSSLLLEFLKGSEQLVCKCLLYHAVHKWAQDLCFVILDQSFSCIQWLFLLYVVCLAYFYFFRVHQSLGLCKHADIYRKVRVLKFKPFEAAGMVLPITQSERSSLCSAYTYPPRSSDLVWSSPKTCSLQVASQCRPTILRLGRNGTSMKSQPQWFEISFSWLFARCNFM